MKKRILDFKTFALFEAIYIDKERGRKVNTEAFKKIRTVLFLLNGTNPWFGEILADIKITENTYIRTMATDGFSITYNPQFALNLSEDECLWVFAHEVLHCALGHFARIPIGADGITIWNVATDYAINQMLTIPSSSGGGVSPDTKNPDNIGKMPNGVLYPGCGYIKGDEKFLNKTAEAIYNELIKIGWKPKEDEKIRKPSPPPPLGPPEVPKIGDVIFDPENDTYGIVTLVDEDNDSLEYDPIPKDKVKEYLMKKEEE
jgi:hypothetical protein